jgi:histidyl-tRNA synthetase
MTLSRQPLRGMRELYPPQKRVEDYLIGGIRSAARVYGFEEYEAPVLEPLELFLAKSGTELAREQSYNFTDKGGRELILRPELTPSLARMIAAGGELVFPVKWMSFPDCFRYEKPQRGRVREFLQFNLDILGTADPAAELEVFLVLQRIMRTFKVPDSLYRIRYSSRALAAAALRGAGLPEGEAARAFALLDRRDKMPGGDWESWVLESLPGPGGRSVIEYSRCEALDAPWLISAAGGTVAMEELIAFSGMLGAAGVGAAIFDPAVVRGLDYYTGIVFEVSDTGGENRRAICGGGRYDDLVGLFGGLKVSGVGFGLGILTMQLFLETYGLIAEGVAGRHPAAVFLAAYSQEQRGFVLELAERLRDAGIPVETDISGKGLKKQFSLAEKRGIGRLIVIGPEEVATGCLTVRCGSDRESYETDFDSLAGTLA